jgi:hypothetical protein
MSVHDDEIRRVVAELEAHIAEAEASVVALKALLSDDDEADGGEDLVYPGPR